MRSRYSTFVIANIEYLQKSHYYSTRPSKKTTGSNSIAESYIENDSLVIVLYSELEKIVVISLTNIC